MSSRYIRRQDLTAAQELLIDAAARALENAYCPYSSFAVGAAVRGLDSRIVTGVNVENAAYEVVHAEAHALSQAQIEGICPVTTIAIVCSGNVRVPEEVYGPCGSCRQRIFEFAQKGRVDIEVLSTTIDRQWILSATISDLLPHAFGPAAIEAETAAASVIFPQTKQSVQETL